MALGWGPAILTLIWVIWSNSFVDNLSLWLATIKTASVQDPIRSWADQVCAISGTTPEAAVIFVPAMAVGQPQNALPYCSNFGMYCSLLGCAVVLACTAYCCTVLYCAVMYCDVLCCTHGLQASPRCLRGCTQLTLMPAAAVAGSSSGGQLDLMLGPQQAAAAAAADTSF